MTHEVLRHFADSWGLLFLVLVFAGAVGWTFRPGARAHHAAARMIPLGDDDAPLPEPARAGDGK